jgi:hypothetical protein
MTTEACRACNDGNGPTPLFGGSAVRRNRPGGAHGAGGIGRKRRPADCPSDARLPLTPSGKPRPSALHDAPSAPSAPPVKWCLRGL